MASQVLVLTTLISVCYLTGRSAINDCFSMSLCQKGARF